MAASSLRVSAEMSTSVATKTSPRRVPMISTPDR
jgi:hypothetical protein